MANFKVLRAGNELHTIVTNCFDIYQAISKFENKHDCHGIVQDAKLSHFNEVIEITVLMCFSEDWQETFTFYPFFKDIL